MNYNFLWNRSWNDEYNNTDNLFLYATMYNSTCDQDENIKINKLFL